MRYLKSSVESCRRYLRRWASCFSKLLYFAQWGAAALTGVFPVTASAQLSVQDNGAPSYSFLIAVPPGIAGMEPKISLGYRQGGDGPLGAGWSIGGVSIITRCPATPATDGATPLDSSARHGVNNLPSDKLCLDGQRLIPTDANGTQLGGSIDEARGVGGGFREYRTEQDSFIRVRAYGSAGGSDNNGPAYFRAWTKSGQIYEYGNTADSNVEVEGSTITNFWGVNRLSDTAGNWIDFSYEKRDVVWGSTPSTGAVAGKEWNISEIRYTGHTSVTPFNRVAFIYADRSQTADNAQSRAESYARGAKSVSVRYLQAVRTYTNRTATEIPVRTYKMAYEVSPVTRRLRVTSIQDCRGANEGICLPAATMSYTAGGGADYQEVPNSAGLGSMRLYEQYGSYGVLLGDFDGDGKMDLVRWSNSPAENQLLFSRPVASNSLSAPDAIAFATSASFSITDENLFKSDGCYFSIVGDFNGDGLADILRWASNSTGQRGEGNSCGTGHTSYIYFSKGDGTFRREVVADANGTPLNLPRLKATSSTPPRYGPCPDNNAVRTQPSAAASPQPSSARSGSTPSPQSTPGQCLLAPGTGAGATFYVGDYDGDGRLDIVVANQEARASGDSTPVTVCRYPPCTFVYHGLGDGRFTLVNSPNIANVSVYSDPTTASPQQRMFIDVDGDGLEDLFQPASGDHFRSLGSGDFALVQSNSLIGCNVSAQIGDINGDHKIDRICGNASVANNRVGVSRGDGSLYFPNEFNLTQSGQELITQTGSDGTPTSGGIGFTAIDVNGDGLTDIIRWKDDASQNVVYLSNGDGSFRAPATNLVYFQLKHSNNLYDYVIGDFSGRGNVDILLIADDPSQNKLLVKQDQTPPDLLLSVTSGFGSVTSLAYASIAQSGSPYISSRTPGDPLANPTYPQFLLQSPAYVVAKQLSDAGAGQSPIESHFVYKDMRVDWTGRGMLGFAETRRSSPAPNGEYLTTVTSYRQDFPYIGIANSIVQRRGDVYDNGAMLSSSTSTYCDRLATNGCANSGKIKQPYVQQIVEQGYDLGGVALPTVVTNNTFNTFGDPTQITVQTTGAVGGLNQTFTKVSNNTYTQNTAGDTWILGRLTRSSVTNTVPDDVLPTSAGTSSGASSTQGSPPPAYQPPSPVNPAVLAVILNYLLSD